MEHQEFTIVSRGGLTWIECARLKELPGVLHAFSTRRGGVSSAPAAGLNLGFTEGDQRARVEQNRRLFFEQLGAQHYALASLRQVHSANLYQILRGASAKLEYRPTRDSLPDPRGAFPPAGDGLLTEQSGILLSVRSADCLPVFLVDPKQRAVSAIHAGWRGALARVIEKTAEEMRREFGSQPQQLLAAIGPSIRRCCYQVGEEVVEAFHDRFARAETFMRKTSHPSASWSEQSPFLSPPPSGCGPRTVPAAHLDLVALAREQLLSAGLIPRNISAAEFCTACRTDLFFSYRREGSRTGRMMAVIGIQPETQG